MVILYKRTATGSTQVWSMECIGGRYRTITGKLGGAMTTSEWTQAVPKNVGRANATSAAEQAEAEVAAEYELKRKKGYRDTADDAHENPRFQCMLAQKWEERRGKIVNADGTLKGEVFMQPKLDGIRCIANAQGLWSRENNAITTMSHIELALRQVFETFPGIILDGELYQHELHDDFPKMVSLIKRLQPGSARIEYWIYDCIVPGDPQADFSVRTEWLNELPSTSCLMPVLTVEVRTEAEIQKVYEDHLAAGFEGAMIRLNHPYEGKRSYSLLKMKEMQDAEFLVRDIRPGVGNAATLAKIATVQLPNGKTCDADIVGSREYLQDVLKNRDKYVMHPATIRFFGYTPAGKLRFPKMKIIHLTKRM